MPLHRREYVQFAVLLFCVPVQYLVIQRLGSSEVARTYAISKMVDELSSFGSNWLAIEPWKAWCQSILFESDQPAEGSLQLDLGEEDDEGGDGNEGYFGQSTAVRDSKPPEVEFRVGQVVKHKRWGYYGVITAWDEKGKAPERWIERMHGDRAHWREQPNYIVLVDTRHGKGKTTAYVPQENLELVRNKQVIHPNIDRYFEGFDGSLYLARPWLRNLYPLD